MALTPRQIDQYFTQGYLVVPDALRDEDLDPVIQEYEATIDRRARELHAAGKLSRLYEEEPFERRLACICRETMELYPQMDIMHHRGKAAFDFLRNERLMDLVDAFVGPEIICSPIQHLRAKLPSGIADRNVGDTHIAPWHQDAGVTWEEADPHFILTVWVPLVDATPENGCMRVIPGTHDNGFSEYRPVDMTDQTFHAEIIEVEEDRAVYFEFERGQCSLHDGRIVHGAEANTSPVRRTGYTMRYFPASVKVLPVEQNAGWKIWLARGEDRAGNSYVNV